MTNALTAYQPQNLAELKDVATILAKSGYFLDAKDAAQAVAKIIAGSELGFGPMASMTGIYIVKNRVTLSANLMAAAVKRSGKYNYRVTDLTDTTCAIDFYEGGERVGYSTFTMADAKRADLKGDNWTKYPRNMLFARALSNGVKFYCPDIFGGPIYTPDELGAAVDEEGVIIEGAVVDVGPVPEPPASQEPPADPLVQEGAALATGAPWTVSDGNPGKFLAWAGKTHGLTSVEVCEALAVPNVTHYAGSKEDAIAALLAYVEARTAPKP